MTRVLGTSIEPASAPRTQAFVRDLRRVTLDVIAPTYILDPNFQFVDWNISFENLVARPLGLRLGMHVISFVNQLANLDSVLKRSVRVFAPGQHPLCDTEALVFRSEKFGEIEFQKIASQILDESGQKKAWTVSLNISRAEKWNELWKDLSQWIEKETLWSAFALCSNLITNHEEYVRMVRGLQISIGKVDSSLELGSTDPRLALELARAGATSWIVQPSQTMLEISRSRMGGWVLEQPVTTVRGSFERLEDFAKHGFTTALCLEGMPRIEDPRAVFSHVKRLLRPGGSFHFLAHLRGGTNSLLDSLRAEQVSKLQGQELDSFEKTMSLLNDSFRRFSPEELTQALTGAGFQYVKFHNRLFGDSALSGTAKA